MLSQVAIGNAALSKLGEPPIIDFADGSKAARSVNEAFPRVRDALLRSHLWSFAMTRAQLAKLKTKPLFEFQSQYEIPTDLLRLVQIGEIFVGYNPSNYINSDSVDYRVEGKLLLTDFGSSSAPLAIKYVRRVTDTTTWDPLFDEAIACKLAVELANTITQSDQLKQIAQQEFKATLITAVRTNAIERASEMIADQSWMLSRL